MRSTSDRPPVAPGCRRLVGDARVIAAIGNPRGGLAATEEEVGLARIADRPAALVVVELEQRAALSDRDDILDRLDLRLHVVVVGRLRGERGVAAYHRARRGGNLRRGARLAGGGARGGREG